MRGVNVLVTGAAGFVGRGLVARMLRSGIPGETRPLDNLILVDQRFESVPEGPGVRIVAGDIAEQGFFEKVLADTEVDYVFHLASVPGGAAEKEFRLGLDVNLFATINLLECLRLNECRAAPRFVFASTIGVYEMPMRNRIDENSPAIPTMSYGAQKLMGEILVNDYSRRGIIDGVSIRLPGIVARPKQPSGLLSAFYSDIIHALSAGESFRCPVPAKGRCWWMSRPCVIDNFLHAASMPVAAKTLHRVWQLPVLEATLGDIVAAIARVYGDEVLGRVSYDENPGLEAQFATFPELQCPQAMAAGFRNDGDLETLIQRALMSDTSA